MGGLLQAILQGGGRVGNELQEAKTANKEEFQRQQEQKMRMQQFAMQMQELQGRLKQQGIQGQLETAPQVVHTYQGSDGKMHNLVRDPISGQVSDKVADGPGEMTGGQKKRADFKALVGREPTEEEAAILGGVMPKPPAGQTEYQKESERLTAQEELRKRNPKMWSELHPPRATSAFSDTRSVADKAKDVQTGTATLKDFPTKERGSIATYMRQNNMKANPKLTAQESKLSGLVKQIEPKVDQLKKILEDNKLTDQNDWVFGNSSAVMQWLRFQGYKHGVKPEQTHASLIKAAAALQVMGAAPWIQIGRGRYLFDTIVQHLPSPTDTPALLYDKALFLQGIMDEAKDAIPKADESSDGGAKKEELIPGEEVEQ